MKITATTTTITAETATVKNVVNFALFSMTLQTTFWLKCIFIKLPFVFIEHMQKFITVSHQKPIDQYQQCVGYFEKCV